jgi:TFIIF-interacting CTD phosphatase-like protein
MNREVLGERPQIKYSQFMKNNMGREGLKTLLIDLDETLVHSSFTQVDDPDFILSVRF